MRTLFKVYYLDKVLEGKTFSEWKSMPSEGVLGVVEVTDRLYGHPRKCAGTRHAYRDYYWMNADGEIGAGSAKQIPDGVEIKRGTYVDDETWMDIYNNRIMVDDVVTG